VLNSAPSAVHDDPLKNFAKCGQECEGSVAVSQARVFVRLLYEDSSAFLPGAGKVSQLEAGCEQGW